MSDKELVIEYIEGLPDNLSREEIVRLLAQFAEVALEQRSKPGRKYRKTLDELVEGMTEEYRHGEWKTGPAVGNEAW